MSPALVPADDGARLPARLLAEAERLAQRDLADNTRRAYRQDWKRFEEWCRLATRAPLPASVETLLGYLTELATTPTRQTGKPTRPGSIGRALAAIAWVHLQRGVKEPATTAPVLRRLLRGIRRELGVRQTGKRPLLWSQVREASRLMPPGELLAARDRAVLLLGFAAALRRSEHATLLVEDLEHLPEGLVVHFGRTKGDQEARGETVAIPRQPGEGAECPVAATQAWLAVLKEEHGPLFRGISRHGSLILGPEGDRGLSDVGISRAVKRAARLLGLDAREYSGHSLRSGFATTAAEAEVPIDLIRTHMRQKNIQTTITYVRRARPFDANAFGGMFK